MSRKHYIEVADSELRAFIGGYIEAALWTTSIGSDFAAAHNEKSGEDWREDSSMMDFGFTESDLSADCLERVEEECRAFCESNYADLLLYADGRTYDPSQGDAWDYAGHDFLLTRDGHGAGFWDRGLGELGERLSDNARPYGESGFYVGDDETIYCDNGPASAGQKGI